MQLAMASDDKEEAVASPEVIGREGETMDLLSKIDAFTETDERLRADAARAHYNMGNIYYQKGEYEIAAREYYQAVTLMPDDPDAHYNLALTSSEKLHDFKTALKHYKMYLYLNPDAKDVAFVHEKIVEAELNLRSHVDSKLDDKVE
jgi:tetratricopeptide (TPR) repeat protein